jgi:hypothetical protein
MKKTFISLAALLLMFALVPANVLAQDQDQGQQDQGYGAWDQAQNQPQAQPEPPPPPAGTPDASAQQQPGQEQSTDQPGVARLSFMNGAVSIQRGDNGDWVAGTVNTPVAVGDRISTGQAARAELQLDYADVLRLSSSATAKVANLNRSNIQVQVGQGLTTYTVLQGAQAASEIDTPNASLHPDGPGEYRILVNSDAETQIVIRGGSADVSTPQGSTHVDSGQMITVAGTQDAQYKTDPAPARDEWDSWNDDRNHRISSAQSWGKTDRYYTGSEDLDGYGAWSEVPDYGPVWIPSQGPDWAPYRDGSWVYEPYYGWTWVSYEPWGWAPYHYGRWFVYGGQWAWWPGPVVGYPGYYPIWSPAYVSFFGWGGGGWGFGVGFGFGFGFGHIGWLPIGPGDRFYPWYGRFGGRTTVINNHFEGGIRPLAGNGFGGQRFSNFDGALTNDRIRNGISSMAGNEFGHGRVPMHQDHISAASFRGSSMLSGKMPVSPSRESFSAAGRAANPASFRNAPSSSQHFFTASSRVNAGANSRSLAGNNPGFRGGSNGSSFSRPSQNANMNRGETRGTVQSTRPGWHTFTPPSSGSTNRSEQGYEGRSGQNNTNRETYGNYGNRSNSSPYDNRGGYQGYSNRSTEQRGNYGSSYSRPQLDMRQPIVTPRRGGSYGGNYSQPRSYNAPRQYSAPRGNSSAPRGNYSAPRGGGSRGGGGSHGGGGGHGGGHR